MEVLLWFLTIYGLTNIVVYGSILNPIRSAIKWLATKPNKLLLFPYVFEFIKSLTSCVMCFSTWVGFFAGWLWYSPTMAYFEINYDYIWTGYILDAFLASGATWMINTIVEHFEK